MQYNIMCCIVSILAGDEEKTMMGQNRKWIGQVVHAALLLPLLQAFPGPALAQSWHPLRVDVWEPRFNTEMKRRTDNYVPLEKAAKAWRICTSIPHLKDPYWAAVNFGLIDEAKRMGVGMRLFEAGGYGNLELQRKQIGECMASGADALIVSGISADGLNDLVEKYAG